MNQGADPVELLVLCILLCALAIAGAGLIAYSRTEHGFFTLRELRRRLRLVGYQWRRRIEGGGHPL
jgi:hypothetical protein